MMSLRNSFLIFIYCLLACHTGNAHYYKHYTTSDGFISNDVYHIEKDKKGYLWFCTTKGVVKYNGQSYEKYTISNGLTDNDVFNCYEDEQGRMWFYTYNGKYCYYKNGTIYNATNDSFLKKMPESPFLYINAMFDDAEDSTLYIGYVNGPILQIKNKLIHVIDIDLSSSVKLRCLYKSNGILKATTHNFWFSIVGNRIENRIDKKPHESYFSNNRLITSDDDGVKLYENEHLVWSVNDKATSLPNIYHVYYDGDNHVFCGTKNGLVVYNTRTGKKHVFFEGIRITSSMSDIHGNYWVSSFGNGIFRINKGDLDNSQMLGNIKNCNLVQNKAGQLIIKNGDRIFTIAQSDKGIKLKQLLFTPRKLFEPVYLTSDHLFYYSAGKTQGYYSINLNSGIEKKYNNEMYYKAFRDTTGKYVLLNVEKLHLYTHTGDSLKILDKHFFKNTLIAEHFIKEINCLYFISKNVFYRYSINNLKVKAIDTIENIGGNNHIFYENGFVFILVNNTEMVMYTADEIAKKIARVKLDKPVYNIIKLQPYTYIINTDNGYELLKVSKKNPFSITTNEILYPFEQKDILYLYRYHNYLICKIGDELYSFPQDMLNKHLYKPKLYIEKVILNGKKYPVDNHNINANNKTDVKVVMSAVCFTNDRLKYRYRIIDDDKETGQWHSSQNEELNFLFNSPGEYSIQIQAYVSNTAISNTETIRLNIKPAFFSSLPFYLLCAGAISVFLVLVVRYNDKRKKKAFKAEMNYLQLEHKAVNSLINPHFIFNAVNNIQNLVNNSEKELANEYLATLSIMIRQNMENLQHNLIPLAKELSLIESYIELQNLRFNNHIGFVLEHNVTHNVNIPPLLIHTFVENSIIHGYKQQNETFYISVKTELLADDYLTITITDNGTGIDNANQNHQVQKNKTSLGISFTRKRLKRLSEFYKVNYSLELKDLSAVSNKTGTEVKIVIYSRFENIVNQETFSPAH